MFHHVVGWPATAAKFEPLERVSSQFWQEMIECIAEALLGGATITKLETLDMLKASTAGEGLQSGPFRVLFVVVEVEIPIQMRCRDVR